MEFLCKLAAVCVLSAALSLFLKEQKQAAAVFVLLALTAVALPAVWEFLRPVLSFFERLMDLSALPRQFYAPMLKVVCIAAVTRIGMDFCKDAESETAAALLEIGGTCCALAAALPLMERVLELFQKMM